MRDIRTSLQDDTEEGYKPERCEISNFGKEIHTSKSIVRANTSIAMVQLRLQKRANDGRCRGPPHGGRLRYDLSSLATYSTWEGDN